MWEEANAEQLQPCNPGSDSLLVLLTQLGFPNQYENQHLTVRTGLSDCKDGSKHTTRACPGYASDILNGTSLKPTNAHSGTFTVTEPVKPTLTSFAWLHDRRVLGVISSSSATSVLKPFFRMLSFQQLWSRWLIPGSQAELSSYNISSDATHNHRKHVSVEADVGNNLTSNRSQVFRLLSSRPRRLF